MNKQRYNAYKQYIEEHGKASLAQLVRYTASNKFLTKKYLAELIEIGFIVKIESYYYLGQETEDLWN